MEYIQRNNNSERYEYNQERLYIQVYETNHLEDKYIQLKCLLSIKVSDIVSF